MNELGYEPLREIIIHIGEKEIHGDIDPVRVYIDGEKLKISKNFSLKQNLVSHRR